MTREAVAVGLGVGLAVMVLAAATPTAGATSLTHRPQNVDASYDANTDTLTLAWEAPPGASVTEYRVYANGNQLTATADTSTTIHGPEDTDVFYVTAVTQDGDESLPSRPVSTAMDEIPGSGPCLNTDLDQTPPGVWVDPSCLENQVEIGTCLPLPGLARVQTVNLGC